MIISERLAAIVDTSHPLAAGANSGVGLAELSIDTPALLALIWQRRPSPAVRAFLAPCRQAF